MSGVPWRERPLEEQVAYWRAAARKHEQTERNLRSKLRRLVERLDRVSDEMDAIARPERKNT